MNIITVEIGKKQLISRTRVEMAFMKAFHEPPVSYRWVVNSVVVDTHLPLEENRVKRFASCLGLKPRKIEENKALIR